MAPVPVDPTAINPRDVVRFHGGQLRKVDTVKDGHPVCHGIMRWLTPPKEHFKPASEVAALEVKLEISNSERDGHLKALNRRNEELHNTHADWRKLSAENTALRKELAEEKAAVLDLCKDLTKAKGQDDE